MHEFVSETQKGFVPGVFIAEATQLLKLTEAYINEEPEDRKGIFLFMDMEKAFDRVSYDFIKKGLAATGFGKHLRKWVGMMYDVEDAPKRRMYVNGYYSRWFHIKSGVAQGCPLSPLLFLLVGEALKISLDQEEKIKGIQVGKKYYKLSQFADDTTLLLGSLKELKPVRRALNKWCRITGMRENEDKREALGMGVYKNRDLGRGIRWAKEGEWCVSLGVPIGNELDEQRWWAAKINKVRKLTESWLQLPRTKYFGRNMLVQALYFGRLRYWVYSLTQSRNTMEVVQKDADILRWASDPSLEVDSMDNGNEAKNVEAIKNKKRIRRWVARESAAGPREWGGLNAMEWSHHSRAFMIEWILRYIQPGEAAWKTMMDTFILRDKHGKERYPEGRTVLLQDLSVRQKAKIINGIPKGAKYMRQALREFWRIKIKPKKGCKRGIQSESPWYGHRFKAGVPNDVMMYCKNTLRVWQMSDFMNKDTNKPFTYMEWRDWVERIEEENTGVTPDNLHIIQKADDIYAIQKRIPKWVWKELKKDYTTEPKAGKRVYLSHGNITKPAIIMPGDKWAAIMKIDNTGVAHRTVHQTQHRNWTVLEAHTWGKKWAGPRGANYALDTTWDCLGLKDLRQANASELTRAITKYKFKPPNSPEAWR